MDDKYFLMEVSDGDPSIAGVGVYKYDTLNEATANFHTKLGNAMKSDKFTYEMVTIVNSYGKLLMSEVYTAEN